MTTEETLDRFKREHLRYHGISAKRAKGQLALLHRYEEFTGTPVIQCGGEEFRAFAAHLLDSGLAATTVTMYMKAITPYYRWASEVGLIDTEQLSEIKAVPEPNGGASVFNPKPYSTKELRQFWVDLDARWPKRRAPVWKRWRNESLPFKSVWRHAMNVQINAIVRLALDGGLRQREIRRLTLDDASPDNYYIVVRAGKRAHSRRPKPREVPFTKQSRKAVAQWLDLRAEILRAAGESHDSLWLSLYPAPVNGRICKASPTPVYARAMQPHRFGRIVGTCGPYTLHRFRHTCATAWLRAGVRIQVVSRLLGHANINMTLAYTKIIREDINKELHAHEDEFEKLVNPD